MNRFDFFTLFILIKKIFRIVEGLGYLKLHLSILLSLNTGLSSYAKVDSQIDRKIARERLTVKDLGICKQSKKIGFAAI